MKNSEMQQIFEHINKVYCGILANYPVFNTGFDDEIIYDFSCPKYEQLKQEYRIDDIAGKEAHNFLC